jgi:hypothetical protein
MRLDQRGLVRCPWGCGRLVRKTRNNNARTVFIDPQPHNLGRIVAYCDDNGAWHSRQLHRGETELAYERRYMIHTKRLCPAWRRSQGLPPAPAPRPQVVPPPPGPMPKDLAAKTHEELEETRAALERIRRAGRGRGP